MTKLELKQLIQESIAETVDEMTGTGAVGAVTGPMAFKKKKGVQEGADEDPFYVEYHSQRQGENPFMLNGQKFEYCNGKYPNGKIDVAVYAYAGDMCISYNGFRNQHGLKEMEQPEAYDDQSDSFAPGPRQRPEDFEQGGAESSGTVNKAKLKQAMDIVGKLSRRDFQTLMTNAVRDGKVQPEDGVNPKVVNAKLALYYLSKNRV